MTTPKLSPKQCFEARQTFGLSRTHLAGLARLPEQKIKGFELGDDSLTLDEMAALRAALDRYAKLYPPSRRPGMRKPT